MPDYKAMYYHLAGRMATAIDVLEVTTVSLEATTSSLEATTNALKANTGALSVLKEKLKQAQQNTEDMFILSDDEEAGNPQTE